MLLRQTVKKQEGSGRNSLKHQAQTCLLAGKSRGRGLEDCPEARAREEARKTVCKNKPGRVPQGHIPISRALDVPIIHAGEVIGNLAVVAAVTAAAKLTALAEREPDAPAVWRNLATLRGWLADTNGSAEALKKYATLDIPLEDAVEAQTLALFLTVAGDLNRADRRLWKTRASSRVRFANAAISVSFREVAR